MAKRGRPVKSEVRQNIAEILFYLKKAYGYQIAKHYNSIFEPVTKESIYYNLRKGVSLGEFELLEIKQEQGNYSWGSTVEKRYYIIGEKAKLKFKPEPNAYFNAREDVFTQSQPIPDLTTREASTQTTDSTDPDSSDEPIRTTELL